MSYDVSYERVARTQLFRLVTWVSEHLGERATEKALGEVDRLLDRLRANPTQFRRYPGTTPRGDVRLAKAYYHYFAFVVDETSATVAILAIRHESQDPARLARDLGTAP